jgi:hypothetical protein
MATLAKTNFPTVNLKLLLRLFSKIKISTVHVYKDDPCWEWTGFIQPKTGYATVAHYEHPKKFTFSAHRLFYHLFVKPLPAILIVDHLCRVKHCVNPVHLEAVTHKTNSSRGIWTKRSGARYQKTCGRGHPFSGDNLRWEKNYVNNGTRGGSKMRRVCRTCRNERARKRLARLRESALSAM